MLPDLHESVQSLLRGQATLLDVEYVLEQGADANCWEGPLTPLRCAVQADHSQLLQLLLRKNANPNSKDSIGVGPLHIAVFEGKNHCIQVLLDGKADANIADNHGQTPLFFAPNRHVCDLLIAKQADVNVRNSARQSPLHLAAHAGLNDTVTWFVDVTDKKILDVQDKHGCTPLTYATHSRIRSTVNVLKKKGAGISLPFRNRRISSSKICPVAFEAHPTNAEANEPSNVMKDFTEPVQMAAEKSVSLDGDSAQVNLPSQTPHVEKEVITALPSMVDLELQVHAATPRQPAVELREERANGLPEEPNVGLLANPVETPPLSAERLVELCPKSFHASALHCLHEATGRDPQSELLQRHETHSDVDQNILNPGWVELSDERTRKRRATEPARKVAGHYGVQEASETTQKLDVSKVETVVGLLCAAPGQAAKRVSTAGELNADAEACNEDFYAEKEVKHEEKGGCLYWEVVLKKESMEEKYGFVQANGKLDFEQRVVAQNKGAEGKPQGDNRLEGPDVLVVRRIHQGGLLQRWNQQHPNAEVLLGDRICNINGQNTVEGMQREIRSQKISVQFMRYPQHFTVRLAKDGRRFGFRFECPQHANKEDVRITEVSMDGALMLHNMQQVSFGQWQYVVLPGMRIEATNNVSGDALQITEELKKCNVVTLRVRRLEQHSNMTS